MTDKTVYIIATHTDLEIRAYGSKERDRYIDMLAADGYDVAWYPEGEVQEISPADFM